MKPYDCSVNSTGNTCHQHSECQWVVSGPGPHCANTSDVSDTNTRRNHLRQRRTSTF
jgi:hypothetical protein